MESTDHLAALRRDGTALSVALRDGRMDRPVPSCPGWTAADLVWHVSEVHHFWRTMVAGLMTTWDGYVQPPRPADQDLLEFYDDGLAQTVAVLAEADPRAAVWTWSADRTCGFVIRRMAHETAMHRWDAEMVDGAAAPVDGVLASDGIDEFLTHFLGSTADAESQVGSVHVHCTDVAGEWTVVPEGDGFDVRREHMKGDCALRGSANDLLLSLWRRVPLTSIDIVGDRTVAERFVARNALE